MTATHSPHPLAPMIDRWRADRLLFGARLRAARRAAGMTQLELDTVSGVAHEIVSRIELGRQTPTVATLTSLLAALAIEPDALDRREDDGGEGETWRGAIHGEPGVLRSVDGGRLQCHCCGEAFVNLGGHVRQAHGLPAPTYKRFFGLKAGTGLIGAEREAALAAYGRGRVATAEFGRFVEAGRAAGERAGRDQIAARTRGRRASLEEQRDPTRRAARLANLEKAQAALAARRSDEAPPLPLLPVDSDRAGGRARPDDLRRDAA